MQTVGRAVRARKFGLQNAGFEASIWAVLELTRGSRTRTVRLAWLERTLGALPMLDPTSTPRRSMALSRTPARPAHWTAPWRTLCVLSAVLLFASCQTAPIRSIPDPLPETLEWVRAAQGEAAFLGIDVRENDSGSLEELFFAPGVKVTAVADGSPAAEAGFQIGDVLLKLDGQEVNDPGALRAMLEKLDGTADVALDVQRGDSGFRLNVRPRGATGSAEPAELMWRKDTARSLASWHTGAGGVVLVASHPDGPFTDANIPVGSVVVAIDDQAMHSARSLIRELQSHDPGSEVQVAWHAKDDATVRTTNIDLYSPRRVITSATTPVLIGYTAEADGSQSSFYVLDFWFISLFRYRREGHETKYSILRFFTFGSGVGELGE
jgi:hypothetical protein